MLFRAIVAVLLLTSTAHAQSLDLVARAPKMGCLSCPEGIQRHVRALVVLETQQAQMVPRDAVAPVPVTTLPPKLVLLAGGALDAISTARFLAAGQPEDNTALQFLNGHPERMIPLGLGMGVAYALAYDAIHKASPTIAKGFAGLLGAFHTGLAAHNFNMARQAPSVNLINDQLVIRTHRSDGRFAWHD